MPTAMKTKLSLTALLSFTFYLLSSQVPQGFTYQAVARNGNTPIMNTTMPVRITIQDSLGTQIFWQELHSSASSNNFGVINLVLGRGTRQAASTVATFSNIDWSVTPKFIKTEIDFSGWKTMGVTRFWSVPYALSSAGVNGTLPKLMVTGKTTSPDEALFEVKNKDNQTIFAVYNEGVRVYVDNGAKGPKGGFAVGGFGTDKAISQNLLTVTSDSVRIYVDETVAKGSKGGFAVGGFDQTKKTINEFMFLTPENYFIGHSSGQIITTGKYNSTLGYQSGKSLTEGGNNIFIGYKTGYSNSKGGSNVFIGNNAGFSNTTGNYNIILGRSAGYDNTSGWGNIVLGDYAGSSNSTGYQNVIIGDLAGITNTEGFQNVFLGADAGSYNKTGSNNVFIGNGTGSSNTTGNYNSFLGFEAGLGNTSGYFNTFLGYQAGYSSGASSYSTSIGYKAGYALNNWQGGTYVGFEAGLNSTGRQNVFLGSEAGRAFTSGADNVAIGGMAGGSNDSPFQAATGSRNVLIGFHSGYKSSGATDNVIVGAQDPFGATHITGSYNVYLGVDAGNLSATGSRNVFIGYSAGKSETGSDKLYIQNNSSTTPLLWGDFYLKRLSINGNTAINLVPYYAYALQIGLDADDQYALAAYGPAWCSAGVWSTSDIKLKKNVLLLENSLDKVLSLRGVSFDWNKEEHPEMGFSGGKQFGLIAQEVEKVLPELVSEGPGGFKSVDYSKITPILIEAIKEQQNQIEELKKEIALLKSK
jgi:hypothetical protein